MLGVDTNVLVRVLVGDSASQRRVALARLSRLRADGESVLVSSVVLAELAWVLASAYSYDRAQIATAIRGLLATPPFVVSQRDAVVAALDEYEKGPADFSDYLVLELARADGCATLLTFDRRLLRNPACEAP